jgi:hypothetical protein
MARKQWARWLRHPAFVAVLAGLLTFGLGQIHVQSIQNNVSKLTKNVTELGATNKQMQEQTAQLLAAGYRLQPPKIGRGWTPRSTICRSCLVARQAS